MMDEYFVLLSADDGAVLTDELVEERMKEKDIHKKFHPSFLCAIENVFCCEAHFELCQTALHAITDSGKWKGEK